MRGLRRFACLLLLAGASALGAAPPESGAPKADPSLIDLPAAPVPVTPAPAPGAKVKLIGKAVYAFGTKAPCDVSAFPAKLLEIESEVVPAGETLRVQGLPLFDGAKTKSFKGPVTAYFVKAAGVGEVQLTITPFGLKGASDIKRVVFDVDSGTGPQPPPPDVVPPPKPPEPKPAPVVSFRVIFVIESGSTDAKAATVTGAKVVRDYLNLKTTKDGAQPGWREYDPQQVTTTESATFKALWEAVRVDLPAPFVNCVAVEKNGKVDIVPFPATPAAAIALFDTYLGGGK